MRQGRPLDDRDLAVIYHLAHIHRPPWTRQRIADALDCHRGTVSKLVNNDAERCERAWLALRGADLDDHLAQLGVGNADAELVELYEPQDIADPQVFGRALELIATEGWPAVTALVLAGVPKADAARWWKAASSPAASQTDDYRCHLVEQARVHALRRLSLEMREGKAGWQAIRATIQDFYGDFFAGEEDTHRDPLEGVPRSAIRAVVYGDRSDG